MKSTDLIIGEIYTVENLQGERKTIFKHNNEYTQDNISFYNTEPAYYAKDRGASNFSNRKKDYEIATLEEKLWLEICIRAETLVDISILPKINNAYAIY